jgi:NitT/TauT family transport system substrate-binding protein
MDAQTFKDSAQAQKPLIRSADTAKYGVGAMTRERWHTLVEQLVELKLIDQAVAPESCFAEFITAK